MTVNLTEEAAPPEQDLADLRGEVRRFTATERARLGFQTHCDSWMSAHSPEFSRALGAKGWLGMTWPSRYGGAGRTERERLVVNEELLAAGAPIAAHWFAVRQVGPAFLKYGTEGQRAEFLPRIARGECYFAIGMSEPDSGSDLASVRSTAVAGSAGWLVHGRKVWTSHAHEAHYLLALVRTAPLDPGRRHDGLSQFVVDLHGDGVDVRPIISLDGRTHFTEVTLDGARGELVGAGGSGWSQVTSELAYERSGPERFLSTSPLLFELIRECGPRPNAEIGQLLAELRTLRELCVRVADSLQRGETPVVDAALVKDLGTRFEGRVVDAARRLHQVEPDIESDNDLSRLLAEAILHGPDATLRGGTNEILRGVIARALLPQ